MIVQKLPEVSEKIFRSAKIKTTSSGLSFPNGADDAKISISEANLAIDELLD